MIGSTSGELSILPAQVSANGASPISGKEA